MLILLAILLFQLATCQRQEFVSVSTSIGVLQGRHIDLGNDKSQLYSGSAVVFAGIPYAEAPVGELRFQPPQPVRGNLGVYDATHYRSRCPQPNTTIPTNEDCLYLNILTPSADSRQSLPVLVFIDGSDGFTTGGTSEDEVKGIITNLVQRGLVVVTVQYRLGALGFFTTYDDDVSPNLGMLDQVAALEWVRDNIQQFGGDPRRVTLAGQDDGACAVSAHTLSPLSQPLFKQAIIQSGSIYRCYNSLPNVPSRDQPNNQTIPVGPIYGNANYFDATTSASTSSYNAPNVAYDDPSTKLADDLCNIRPEQWASGQLGNLRHCLKNYTVDFFVNHPTGGPTSTWMIVRDNRFLPDNLDELAARRPNIPIIIGTVQDEDADYAFKLINTGHANDPNNIDRWMFDFARRNKLNATEQQKVSQIIRENYGLDGAMGNVPMRDAVSTQPPTTTPGAPQTIIANTWAAGFVQGAQINQPGQAPNIPAPGSGAQGSSNYQQLKKITQIASDQSTSLTTTEIESFVRNGDRHVRVYQFTHVSNVGRHTVPQTQDWKPVFKGQDMFFITMSETIWTRSNYTIEDRRVADNLGQTWANFARDGNVQGWQPTNDATYDYRELSDRPHQEQNYAPQARRVFQEQVNPICQAAQNELAESHNMTVPFPRVQLPPQRRPGTAFGQFDSSASGQNFHLTFQVDSLPFNK